MFGSDWFPSSIDHSSGGGVGTRDVLTWTLSNLDLLAFFSFYFDNLDSVAHNVGLNYRPAVGRTDATVFFTSIPAGEGRVILPSRLGVTIESNQQAPWLLQGPGFLDFVDTTVIVTTAVAFSARWMQRRLVSKGNPVVPVIVTI